MIIDFKEIPQANKGGGYQDSFELLAQDFFEYLGYEIIEHPFRGTDGGTDLIIKETRKGIGGISSFFWVVSCKHFAHSGKAVSYNHEQNILDRVKKNNCDGFIGFYSTLPSPTLHGTFKGLSSLIENQVFNRARIERLLLETIYGRQLARRYFPKSMEKFFSENPQPSNIFNKDTSLKCDNCGTDLLKTKLGNFVTLIKLKDQENAQAKSKEKISKIIFCCKKDCEERLVEFYKSKGFWDEGWGDIALVMMPTHFIASIMSFINGIKKGVYSDEAIEKMKELYLNIYPFVARHHTDIEDKTISKLSRTNFI